MSLIDRFGFFDPTQPFSVTYGELPHWEQEGATYFITFRTADSLPVSVVELLTRQRDDWLRRNGINPDSEDWVAALRLLSHDLQRAFHREYATKLEAALDQGHGACVLRDRKLAKIVSDSLLHFDGSHVAELTVAESLRDSDDELRSNSSTKIPPVRYHISDFVVMPNHVHVIVCFLPGVRLLAQCRSWKHFTAVRINSALGTTGEFWQSESFDHLVRDPDNFMQFRKYVAENREKANLKSDEGIYYRCPDP
jgi:putative transposase